MSKGSWTLTAVLSPLIAFALGACGGGSSGASGGRGRISHPTGATDVVVRVLTGGGFVAPELRTANLPEVTVYGDGRVIIVGPTALRYPGPALPNLQEFRVTDAGLQRILDAARDAGLLDAKAPSYGRPNVTDLPTTRVIVDAARRRHDVSAYALGAEHGVSGVNEAQREARQRLTNFTRLAGDAEALRRDVIKGSTKRYEPDAVAVFVRPFEPRSAPDGPTEPTVDWPGGDLNAGNATPSPSDNATCLVIKGAQRDAVLAVARTTTQNARWRAGSATYSLVFRPLLPDERDCTDAENR